MSKPIELLPDEITFDTINKLSFQSICHQLVERGRWAYSGAANSTSFFIHKNILLTSAHNVVRSPRAARKVHISPSRLGDDCPLGTLWMSLDYSKRIRIYPKYKYSVRKTHSLYDFAIIYIPDSVINKYPEFSALTPIPILDDFSTIKEGEPIYCAGYPDENIHKGRRWMTLDSSTIKSISNHSFSHGLDTARGNSGSPIMVKREEQFYAIGVNSIKYSGTLIKKKWLKKTMNSLKLK